jgi:cell division protein FtsX
MRILKYALKNIIRNPFLSLSSIFVIALLLFFVNVLVFVLFASENFITDVQSRIKFTINYQSGYELNSLQSRVMIDELRATYSGIVVTPITREEAYEKNKILYPDLISIIESS